MGDYEPTSEGKRLVERWKRAVAEEKRLDRERNRARCETKNAANALGQWLVPADAVDGEVFCVWWGNELIQVSLPFRNATDYRINIRERQARSDNDDTDNPFTEDK